jgi:hypothetical protein
MFPLRLPVFNTAMMQREREASQKALRYATAAWKVIRKKLSARCVAASA